jgi:hypothetical protein
MITSELLVDHVLLDLADALHDRLAGGLRGNATEILRRHLDLELVANLGVGLELARLCKSDLVVRVLHLLDDERLRKRADVTRLRVDVDAQLTRDGKRLLRGGQQRAGNRLDKDVAADSSFALEVVEHGEHFSVHRKSDRCVGKLAP